MTFDKTKYAAMGCHNVVWCDRCADLPIDRPARTCSRRCRDE